MVLATVVGAQIARKVILIVVGQHCYERFQNMKPLQCHGGKSEDIAYEILTLCHEMLEAVGMKDARGVFLLHFNFVRVPESSR